jgi:hypothetical protein
MEAPEAGVLLMALPPNMVAQGIDLEDTEGLPDVEIPVNEPINFDGGAEVIDDGQGGAIVQALAMAEEMAPEELIPFDANLAEFLDEGTLGELSTELRGFYEDDLESRSEWEEAYVKGLDLLGIKYEDRTTPFEGASGITHPLIAESVTQFQAQAYKELLPSGGPVRSQVLGAKTPEKEAQATRVKNFMTIRIRIRCCITSRFRVRLSRRFTTTSRVSVRWQSLFRRRTLLCPTPPLTWRRRLV